jgi:superfamily I DNA and/or RNA helicase
LLELVKPSIILVEEAGEILESCLVTCLNPAVQHLILIGDWMQLRPTVSIELAAKHDMDISLLERMILNKMDYSTLSNQCRMRPIIADLLRLFYPNLKDHPRVLQYPPTPHMSKDLFLVQHRQLEESSSISRSLVNKHEVTQIVTLCQHFLKQKVTPSSITILTMYKGQLAEIRHELKRASIHGVVTQTVDNYQGDENDIVLLSLVRSNTRKEIGFLKRTNRTIVALSRARMALYIFGNDEMLGNNRPWQLVLEKLAEKKLFGFYLPVQ